MLTTSIEKPLPFNVSFIETVDQANIIIDRITNDTSAIIGIDCEASIEMSRFWFLSFFKMFEQI